MREKLSVIEPQAYQVHRAAQKREMRAGVIQASKPLVQELKAHPPEGRWIGDAIGIHYRRRGVFQRKVFQEVALQRLAAGDETVVAVGRRQRRQEGERDAASVADPPSNRNPIVIFVVGLFAPPAMAGDGIL